MNPEVAVLLGLWIAVMSTGVPLIYKGISKNKDKCENIELRQTRIETKLDIFLDQQGFDVMKVNSKIKEHIEELKQNDVPHVGGCIKVKELYKEQQ